MLLLQPCVLSWYQGDGSPIDIVQGSVWTSLTCILPAGLFGYYFASEDVRVHNGVSWAARTARIVVVCVILLAVYFMVSVYQ